MRSRLRIGRPLRYAVVATAAAIVMFTVLSPNAAAQVEREGAPIGKSFGAQTSQRSARAKRVTQRVTLRVRPPVGDTLRMRMDQSFELSQDGDEGQMQNVMSASVRVSTRTIVLGNDASGTELMAVTDSVEIEPAVATTLKLFSDLKRSLSGRSVRIRMAHNGTIRVLDVDHRDEPAASLSPMPAMLPNGPVRVGDTWNCEVPVPLSATHDATGAVKAILRLDSLGVDDAVAYVSMRGTFIHSHPHASGEMPADSTFGTISGTLQFDRRLEWMTDSRTTVSLISIVAPKRKNAAPMRVHMKIIQWLRAVPALGE